MVDWSSRGGVYWLCIVEGFEMSESQRWSDAVDELLDTVEQRDIRIAELQSELASYMESDGNLRKRVEELEAELKIQDNANDILTRKVKELEALNRRLTERWEGAKLRYAEDSKRIKQLEAENKKLKKELKKWQTQSRRAAREAYRLKPNPKPKSVRTVQGGLPGLGKNRKN